MDDDPIRTTVTAVKQPLRRLAGPAITEMVARVMDRHYERVRLVQSWQRPIEPEMSPLKMNHVGVEVADVVQQSPNADCLPDRLP